MCKLAGGIKIVFVRFSVIVPLYNKAPYVARTLQSVLYQTYDDYELIVVDDGSTDGSCEAVEKMTLDNPKMRDLHDSGRFKLIKQVNSGVSTARNNGVKMSCGDYLCFLDADDWWADCFLEGINGLINDFPEAGAYGTAYYYYKNAHGRILDYALPKDFCVGYINYFRCYADSMQMPLWTGAVAIPNNVFVEFCGFSEKLTLGEDFYLWVRIALKYKVAFLNKPLSYYFQDLPASQRAVGRLHDPKTHMLWGLDDLEPVEKTNEDYKRLIDKLRVTGLYQYYLDKRYKNAAIQELKKVDWGKQPLSVRLRYKMPVVLLRMWYSFMVFGSKVKQWMIRKKRGEKLSAK